MIHAGADQEGNSSVGNALGILAGMELSVSQQCALEADRANSVWGCTNKIMASQYREEIILSFKSLNMGKILIN